MTKFNELGKVEQAVLEEAYEGIKNGEKKKQKTSQKISAKTLVK